MEEYGVFCGNSEAVDGANHGVDPRRRKHGKVPAGSAVHKDPFTLLGEGHKDVTIGD